MVLVTLMENLAMYGGMKHVPSYSTRVSKNNHKLLICYDRTINLD